MMPIFFPFSGRGKHCQVSSAVCKTWSCVQNLVLCAKLYVSSGLVVDHVFIYCLLILTKPHPTLFILYSHLTGNLSHLFTIKMRVGRRETDCPTLVTTENNKS